MEFQLDTEKDRGLLCCLPTYSPLGDATIIAHANLHPIGYMYQDLSNTRSLPKDKMKKGKGEDHLDSSIK